MNHPSTSTRPPGRYGERGPNRALIAVLAVLGAALLGWLVWAAVAASTPETRSRLISFQVVDDRQVKVRFEVVADNSSPVACTVQAQDASGETVGVTTVKIAGDGDERREAETVLATRARAVNATLAGCRLEADD